MSAPYLPWECFSAADRGDVPVPRVFISPQRYIQGRGVLRSIGRYLSLVRVKRAAILVSERGRRNEGGQVLDYCAKEKGAPGLGGWGGGAGSDNRDSVAPRPC